jgi:hypothetical protein
MHRCGGRTHGYRVPGSDKGRESFFKFLVPRACGDPAGAQNLGDSRNFGVADAGQRKGQKWQFHSSGFRQK